jgi:tryptophan synthase alpha chain
MDFLLKTFERTRQERRPAIVGYITAGDPDIERSFEIIEAACDGGLDILELGIPFSDPMADGVVIQRASKRAIQAGMTLKKGIEFIQRLRKRHDLPIILFSYYNPIYVYGVERFAMDIASACADGILVVDLPYEKADEIMYHVPPYFFSGPKDDRLPLRFINMVAPTTDAERRKKIVSHSRGFVYLISRHGVTGGNNNKIDWEKLGNLIGEMRKEMKKALDIIIPICIGFGVSTHEDVQKASKIADGVVIGSAIQQLIESDPDNAPNAVKQFIQNIRGK